MLNFLSEKFSKRKEENYIEKAHLMQEKSLQ